MHMYSKFKRTIFFPVLLTLTACGGGSSTSNDQKQSTELTGSGQFVDSEVSGLSYKIYDDEGNITSSGITNSEGRYLYNPIGSDKEVEFFIGNTSIGKTTISSIITPLNLMSADHHQDYGINIARLLQTLDSDLNPDNGIEITADTIENFNTSYAESSIDFNVSAEEFEEAVNEKINEYAQTNLVDIDDASDHLDNTINTILGETAVLDLLGTTWRTETLLVKMYSDFPEGDGNLRFTHQCGDGFVGIGIYDEVTYGEETNIATVRDYFNSSDCTVSDEVETIEFPYNSNALCASNLCTYKELNHSRLIMHWDSDDQRYEGVMKSHTIGSNEIIIKKVVEHQRTTYFEGEERYVTHNVKRVFFNKAKRVD